MDLTGGLAECWRVGDCGPEVEQRPEQDFHQVRRRRLDLNHLSSVKDQCAVSCSTHSSLGGQEKKGASTSCLDPVSHHIMSSVTSVLGAGEVGQYHALTVMEWSDVKMLSGNKVLLLRVRNPWGRCCWGGAWVER